MRYLVLSDIHANLEALERTLAEAAAQEYERVLVLGDLVGYGADPNAVVDRVRALNPVAVIRGNHDKVAAGLDDGSGFNPVARDAALWTHDQLTPANLNYLIDLPAGPITIDESIEICHGAPFDEDTYVVDELDAGEAFDAVHHRICFFGHTHLTAVFERSGAGITFVPLMAAPKETVRLADGTNYLINPGSVGQPRDGDVRARFAVADTTRGEVALYRVVYDVEKAQTKVLEAGLPNVLAYRLALGR